VLSAAPLAARIAFAKPREHAPLAAVIVDSRHAPASDFGTRAAVQGIPVRAIEGDITYVWQTELSALWKAGPGAIAGLTERPALFLLERLAWDHGLRVAFEAEHRPDRHGYAAHRVRRTADPNLALELEAAGRSWPHALADALVADDRVRSADFRPTDAGLAAHGGEPTPLLSWIIAPRVAVRREA
jgi:hypothetical protein